MHEHVVLNEEDFTEIINAIIGCYTTPKLQWYQRLAVGIYCSLYFNDSPMYQKWATDWLQGDDYTLVTTLETLILAYQLPDDDLSRAVKINVLTAIMLHAPCLHEITGISMVPAQLIEKSVTAILQHSQDIDSAFGTPIHPRLQHYIEKAVNITYRE